MIKKYLTKPEEILALRDTDTKIYKDNASREYYQFIDGVLCRFYPSSTPIFNAGIDVNGSYYILVEEPVKEVTGEDIGKLCWFWDNESRGCPSVGVLEELFGVDTFKYKTRGFRWQHCRRLTPAEVAEITGYKVEE